MNEQFKVTWRTLCIIAHSLMVHAQVLKDYIHFALMYTADHIFPVLPIKDLINKYGELTTPFKLATGTKSSISQFTCFIFPCVVQKATAHFDTKVLNMRLQSQSSFCGIFVGIPQHQKVYLVYVTHKRKIVSSYNFIFDEIFSSALAYT